MAEDINDEDVFLSDVHVGTFAPLSEKGTVVSRFVLQIPESLTSQYLEAKRSIGGLGVPAEAEVDEDGDMIVSRREQWEIIIEHAMSTPLGSVGRQVWRGAVLMVDYILHCGPRFNGATVLELGSGVGLVGVAAALLTRHVFCTDVGGEVLDVCKRNVELNKSTSPYLGSIDVRELDWKDPFPGSRKQDACVYSLSEGDLKALQQVDYVLATEVIYDNAITDCFFSCLGELCSRLKSSVVILIALERRINFTLEDLCPSSPAYRHFRDCMARQYVSHDGSVYTYTHIRLCTEFPEYVLCRQGRIKEMELWELQLANVSNSE